MGGFAIKDIFPFFILYVHCLGILVDCACLFVSWFRSWRVRWSIANKFHELCSALGGQVTNDTMCEGYEALLQDSEAEVKT